MSNTRSAMHLHTLTPDWVPGPDDVPVGVVGTALMWTTQDTLDAHGLAEVKRMMGIDGPVPPEFRRALVSLTIEQWSELTDVAIIGADYLVHGVGDDEEKSNKALADRVRDIIEDAYQQYQRTKD